MRNTVLLLLHLCLILAFSLPPIFPVFGQESPGLTPQVSYTFEDTLVFTASVDMEKEIARSVVFLRADGANQTDILIAEFQPGTGRFSAERDLQQMPLAPFSRLTYWWHLDFTDGTSYESSPYAFQYFDNRYVWRFDSSVQEQRSIQVFWKTSSSDLGTAAINTALEVIPEIERQTARPAPEMISIFIYAEPDELLSVIPINDHTVAGRTIPEFSTILLVIEDHDDAALQLERLLPHELAHLFLFQRLGSSYNNLPNWLVEGFAVLQEKNPDPALRLALENAIAEDTLLPVQTLCGTFPAQYESAILAYAESASFLQYILDVYGTGAFSALLDAYQDGASCEGAVDRVFQRDLQDLESEWIETLSANHGFTLQSILPWTLLLPLVLLLGYSLLLRQKPR